MLHLVSNIHSPEDWDSMQRAHAEASSRLGRDPITDANADRLARTVVNLFQTGIRNEEELAVRASEEEAAITAAKGEHHRLLAENRARPAS